MPNEKLSHSGNRAKVCLICFEKGKSLTVLKENSANYNRVKALFLENYDIQDEQ